MPRYYLVREDDSSGCGCILLILIAVAIYFAVSHGSSAHQNTSSLDTARSTIQQYYNAINNHQYRVAYNTWQDNVTGAGQSYEQFAAGYGNTVHDDISFDSVVPQDDTTVDVNITIHAHERHGTETFSASYVVGKVGDIWKIMSGSIQKIA